MRIDKKIEDYLNEDIDGDEILEQDEFFDDSEVMHRMFEFITGLEDLPEELAEEAAAIIEEIAPEIDDVDEAIAAKRTKIKPAERRKRKREYRKKKVRLKMKAKRFRRTAKFKKWKRMKERKAKSGKTATGKRIRTWI